jgi:hypothetical protein
MINCIRTGEQAWSNMAGNGRQGRTCAATREKANNGCHGRMVHLRGRIRAKKMTS